MRHLIEGYLAEFNELNFLRLWCAESDDLDKCLFEHFLPKSTHATCFLSSLWSWLYTFHNGAENVLKEMLSTILDH